MNSANDFQGKAKSPSNRRAWRMGSATLIDGHIVTGLGPAIEGSRANQAVMILLLDHMGAPSGDTRAHKHSSIQIAGNAHHHICHSGIEIESGIEDIPLTSDSNNKHRH